MKRRGESNEPHIIKSKVEVLIYYMKLIYNTYILSYSLLTIAIFRAFIE